MSFIAIVLYLMCSFFFIHHLKWAGQGCGLSGAYSGNAAGGNLAKPIYMAACF